MAAPPRVLTGKRAQALFIGVAAAALAIGGFEAGRKTVDAAAIAESVATKSAQPLTDLVSQTKTLLERDHGQITVREIATVPFSQLYDVLRSASREQLLAWARDLEQMPRGPHQRAAVTAYYKSLIQVDHRAVIEAVLQAKNLNMRDLAIDALLKAAPESIWGDLAEMMISLPFQNRGGSREDVIWNWSRVDPAAVSKFIESHPENSGDDGRLSSLMSHWPAIDPAAARQWLEADPARQTKDAFSAFLLSWEGVDRAAAIDHALANAHRPNFAEAINALAYQFVRTAKEDATRFILLLPPEQARAAVKNIAHTTGAVILGLPEGYQRPPEEIARWMVGLPVELWSESIGDVAKEWLSRDPPGAMLWFDQLRPAMRDRAIASFCRVAESKSAAEVLTLAWTMSDPVSRDKALGEFARSLGTTRDEALDAVNDLPISDDQKVSLRELMPERVNGRYLSMVRAAGVARRRAPGFFDGAAR